jgi:ABC-type bacteriocin/lantibiotic exporter with double-glycine peptidase domain
VKNMNDEKIRQLMMKIVDGVASPEDEKAMAEAIKENEKWRSELQAFIKIKEVTEKMQFKDLPDSYWTGYWGDIYRRTERTFAWILMSIGLIVILGFFTFMALSRFYTDPNISLLLKVGVSMALLGVIIMVISILRERLFARKRERYEKEVER